MLENICHITPEKPVLKQATLTKPSKQKHRYTAIIVLGVLLCFTTMAAQAQYIKNGRQIPDSVYLEKHSAHKATFMSALLPGLGQVYNQKYWKVPIIYAGYVGLIYYADYNNFVYNKYKDGYDIKVKIEIGELPSTDDPFPYASKQTLLQYKDTWRRYRDLCFIGMGFLYVAQIIDAGVDAHMFDYNITDDLSMRIEPALLPTNTAFLSNKPSVPMGFRCAISF